MLLFQYNLADGEKTPCCHIVRGLNVIITSQHWQKRPRKVAGCRSCVSRAESTQVTLVREDPGEKQILEKGTRHVLKQTSSWRVSSFNNCFLYRPVTFPGWRSPGVGTLPLLNRRYRCICEPSLNPELWGVGSEGHQCWVQDINHFQEQKTYLTVASPVHINFTSCLVKLTLRPGLTETVPDVTETVPDLTRNS